MIRTVKIAGLVAGMSIAFPASVIVAFAAQPDGAIADEAGVCTDLGCTGGETKCASGVLTLPGGGSATYTCYTTRPPGEM